MKGDSRRRASVLVIGIGNEFRGDDAVGLVVARRLRAHAGPGLEVREASGEATELMRLLEGRSRVVVVDAMRSGWDPRNVAEGKGALNVDPKHGDLYLQA